jgi:hypothetical protein
MNHISDFLVMQYLSTSGIQINVFILSAINLAFCTLFLNLYALKYKELYINICLWNAPMNASFPGFFFGKDCSLTTLKLVV